MSLRRHEILFGGKKAVLLILMVDDEETRAAATQEQHVLDTIDFMKGLMEEDPLRVDEQLSQCFKVEVQRCRALGLSPSATSQRLSVSSAKRLKMRLKTLLFCVKDHLCHWKTSVAGNF